MMFGRDGGLQPDERGAAAEREVRLHARAVSGLDASEQVGQLAAESGKQDVPVGVMQKLEVTVRATASASWHLQVHSGQGGQCIGSPPRACSGSRPTLSLGGTRRGRRDRDGVERCPLMMLRNPASRRQLGVQCVGVIGVVRGTGALSMSGVPQRSHQVPAFGQWAIAGGFVDGSIANP